MRYFVTLEDDNEYCIDVVRAASGGLEVIADNNPFDVDAIVFHHTLSLRVNSRIVELPVEGVVAPALETRINGYPVCARVQSQRMRARAVGRSPLPSERGETLVAPMPGRVLKVLVSCGDTVEAGTPLIVIEAMKMENELRATRPGRVHTVFAEPGATVEGGAKLIDIQ